MIDRRKYTCCQVEGCTRKGYKNKSGTYSFQRGYCPTHYTRFMKHGDPSVGGLPVSHTKCTVGGCTGNGVTRSKSEVFLLGYCLSHYNKFRRYGDPLHDSGKKLLITKHPMHNLWQSIKRRVLNPNYCRWANKWDQAKNKRNNNKQVGVKWYPRSQKWDAVITVNQKNHYLGRYVKWEDAVEARRAAEKRFGVVYSE